MSTRSEFVTLCQTQMSLVATLGASLSVVYLTEDWVNDAPHKLIPVAAYPETAAPWLDTQTLLSLPPDQQTDSILSQGFALTSSETDSTTHPIEVEPVISSSTDSNPTHHSPNLDPEPQKIVIPLVHQDVVMGFLVTGREDRPWNAHEQHQLQDIAHGLTAACLLDRRLQWLQQRYQQQQQVQTQQYQTLRSLLHQLKSPLTALRTFGKLLLKRFLPQDKDHKIADSILQQSDRIKDLLQQVDQTLEIGETQLHLPETTEDVDTFEADRFVTTSSHEVDQPLNLNPVPVPALLPAVNFLESVALEAVLRPLLVSTAAIAEERHLTFSLNLPPQLPPVQGNSKALGEILSNLLDNALKYTPSRGHIELSIRFEDSQLGIGISDTGPGIPPQDLDRLFERGYRGVQAQGKIPGTGLGLAIAQDLIQQMQGNIEVFSPYNPEWTSQMHSEASSTLVGTTFIVWLKFYEY